MKPFLQDTKRIKPVLQDSNTASIQTILYTYKKSFLLQKKIKTFLRVLRKPVLHDKIMYYIYFFKYFYFFGEKKNVQPFLPCAFFCIEVSFTR